MSDSEDDEMKRAIALSLQDTGANDKASAPGRASLLHNDEPITVDSDSEDGDIKRAIFLSLQASNDMPTSTSSAEPGNLPGIPAQREGNSALNKPAVPALVPAASASGILGLDRRAMEQERLARQALKRRADGDTSGISPPPTKREARSHIPKPPTATTAAPRPRSPRPTMPTSALSTKSTPKTPTLYPRGIVLRTASSAHPRDPDTITMAELLHASSLRLAVLSAFQWDADWLLTHLPNASTKLILVLSAKDAATRARHEADVAGAPNLRLCFPPMHGQVNCMHSKLMLLGYADRLRVAVPTANLTQYDWGETGVMENSVFVIDLPRRKDGARGTEREMGMFGCELARFCNALTLDRKVVDSLSEFEWSGAEGLAFVHAIGGEHTNEGAAVGDDGEEEGDESAVWRRTGAPGLGMAVRKLGLARDKEEEIEVDFVASSVGALNDDFLASLYLACKGDDGTTEFNWRTNACNIVRHAEQKLRGLGGRSKAPEADVSERAQLVASARSNFRLFFPSRETVIASRGGANSAGIICFRASWYEGPKFPKEIMRDCKSKRQGLLMHNKVSLSISHFLCTGHRQTVFWLLLRFSPCSEPIDVVASPHCLHAGRHQVFPTNGYAYAEAALNPSRPSLRHGRVQLAVVADTRSTSNSLLVGNSHKTRAFAPLIRGLPWRQTRMSS